MTYLVDRSLPVSSVPSPATLAVLRELARLGVPVGEARPVAERIVAAVEASWQDEVRAWTRALFEDVAA